MFGLKLTGQTTWYVTPTGNGTVTGASWANAAADLQTVINNATAGDEIWVAAGTYNPTLDPFGNTSPTDVRNKTFYLKSGVKIYGGFAGTETTRPQRNYKINKTILNGTNAYHVIISVNDDNTTVLDGFTITGGNAIGINRFITVETVSIDAKFGGGFYNSYQSNPTISNCIFSGNSAFQGGGVYNINSSVPTFTNCIFFGNSAQNGGGLFSQFASPIFINTTFTGNTATGSGGGLNIDNTSTPNSTITNCISWGNTGDDVIGTGNVTYSIIQGGFSGTGNLNVDPLFKNAANPIGADGIWGTSDDGLQLSLCSPAIDAGTNSGAPGVDYVGNTIFNNIKDMGAYESNLAGNPIANITGTTTACDLVTLTATGGTTYLWSGGNSIHSATNTFNNSGTYTVTVTNAGGCSAIASQIVNVSPAITPTISISASPSNTIVGPLGKTITFTATATGTGSDPYYSWYVNDFKISSGTATTYSISSLQNNDTVKCVLSISPLDMCYTVSSVTSNMITMSVTCPSPSLSVLYVKTISSGTKDGSSWANATNDIQKALDNACGITEIWVAAGTYNPTQDPFGNTSPTDVRDKTFHLKNGIKLYGGFAGTETALAQRNYKTNKTILDGANAYHVVVSVNDDNTTVLDGFTVTGGKANGSTSLIVEAVNIDAGLGGGMYNSYNSSPTITNCVFINNAASVQGGGFYNFNASAPTITNCFFSNNTCTGTGGAVYNQYSSPSITNCVFSSNMAIQGGAIFYESSAPTIINCVFNGNSDGLFNNDPLSNATITNCISFSNSNADGLKNDIVTYSIIQGGFSGIGNLNADPLFKNAANAIGSDGIWGTTDDGLQLSYNSSAYNAGTNTDAPTTDILGNPIFGGIKDMGAYESQINLNIVKVALKVFLQGPYNASTGLMIDGLRSGGYIPTTNPYGGTETFNATVLSVTGNNAIVDWVKVELRDKNSPTTILYTRNALLQSDGDIVETDGVSPVLFTGVDADNYYIAVKHRNHLGFRTMNTSGLSNTIFTLNFTDNSTAVFGTNALNNVSGVYMMYAGDADVNGTINATDRSTTWNNRNKTGYIYNDFSMNGVVDATDRSHAWNNRNKTSSF